MAPPVSLPRRAAKGLLREAFDRLPQLTATGAAARVGVSPALLGAMADDARANLPTADTLRHVADYLDDGSRDLHALAVKLRRQAGVIDRHESRG